MNMSQYRNIYDGAASLNSLFDSMTLDTETDYSVASPIDYDEYEIGSISASAAICLIENYVHYFDNCQKNLQELALFSYLSQFDFTTKPIDKLFEIRNSSMTNAFICEEWDQIKCFLHLMKCSGIPLYITVDNRNPCGCCDGYSDTTIVFDKFIITRTISETRFVDDFTLGFSYCVNTNYHSLLLLLSGDVETNPGPTTHSKFCDEEKDRQQRKQISMMQREISKLRKAQQQHERFMQRQLELEKRNRKKNREQQSDNKRYAEGLFGFAGNVGSVTETLSNKAGPTLDLAQKALQMIYDTSSELRNLFSIPNEFDLPGIVVSLISILNSLMNKCLFTLTMHCAQLARQLGLSVSALMGLVPSIDAEEEKIEFFDAQEEPVRVGQSLVSDLFQSMKTNTHLMPFAGFLSFLCGIFTLLCSGKVPTPEKMTSHFSNVGRAANGFRAIKDLFAWIGSYFSEIYYTTVYGLTVEEYNFMQNFPQLENIYAAIKIAERLDKTVIDSSAAIANQILSMNHQLDEYHYQANKMNSRNNVSLVDSLRRRLKEKVEWASHSPARCHAVRVQPIAVYLYGHPGVGKSVATEVLKARIYKEYLKDLGIKYESCSFARRAQNEYWEGYTNQPIIILDDFGNVKDSQVKPVEEYEELEYMVNTATFPLKMAELKSKGCTNFTSEYIIASSNQKYPDIKHLTDNGAVYRRFHVWAEVSINPNFGKPIGKDEHGNAYYTFDRNAAAKAKKCEVHELDPLMTEHYRMKLYTVKHNKQTGNAEVNYVPGMQEATFEQFWNYFKEENQRQKTENTKLANAIRKEAGIEVPEVPKTEQQILDQFDRIFNPEKFLEAVVEEDVFFDPEEVPEEIDSDSEEDDSDIEDEFFDSLDETIRKRTRLEKLREIFNSYKNKINLKIKKWYTKLMETCSTIKSKFLSVAQFLLSLFTSPINKVISYLPRVPTAKVLTGLFSTLLAVFGVWYTGMFCGQSSSNRLHICKFNLSPSDSFTPCNACDACDILQYPAKGDMVLHFFERTGIKPVRQALYELCWSRSQLEDLREELRQSLKEQTPEFVPQAQALFGKCKVLQRANSNQSITTYQEAMQIIGERCYFNCVFCPQIATIEGYNPFDNEDIIRYANEMMDLGRLSAQRVYDSQPMVPKLHNYAQRVYENQPRVVKPTHFAQKESDNKVGKYAQGLVECKTEMHLGARKYAQRDRVQIEQTTQVLLNNSVWIQAVDRNGMCCRSNGVFLVGRTMITTAHTILNPPHIDPVEYLIIRNPYATTDAIKIPLKECKISQIEQIDGTLVDLVLVSFPPVVPNRPRILNKFLDSQNIDMLKEGDMTFSGFYEVNGKTIVQEKYPSCFEVSCKTTEYFLHKPGTCPIDPSACKCPIRIGNHVEYDLETVSGMCGALLSVSNKLVHTKLIGFHVAGGAGVLALGVLTTRQLLESALEQHVTKFNIPKSYLIDGRLPYSQSWIDPKCKVSLLDLGDCISVGTAPSPSAPSKTQLSPSLVFDKIQKHIAKPAHLTPVLVEGEGVVDPMLKGLKKIMGGQTWVDPHLLDAAINDVFQGLGTAPSGRGIVHSYEEAIKGVEGDPYKRPINRTTSPGYPYNLNNKSKGKTHWLGDGDEYIVDNPELKRDVENLIERSRNGERGDAISIATLKDEKRPIAKTDAGKTRVFEACPQHLVIAIRQYFLDFAAHVMRNRINNGIAVGINPYSLEWTKLAHHLQSKGNYMIAGDFSNFDGSLLMQILVKIVEKINEWYNDDEESQLIRAALWEHICNADIIVRGEIIRKTHSQPSGNPLTVIINSLFNGTVMRVAYLLLKRERGLPTVCDYRKHVAEIIYGDDDIKSVSIEILDWFNQLTLTDALASFGLTYTDEAKTGKILPYKPLEDVAFLKRKFAIQKDGTFLAPMDLENILEITNWIRGKAKKAATIENCEQTIMELSLHPQSVYVFWSGRIREELNKVGLNIIVPTYYEQMETYRYNRDMYERTEYVPLW